MVRIEHLPQEVREKIAAGEVIERPLSVVKELVENSIDAGAGRISVSLSQGGKSWIVVEDDGRGIPFEDLPMAVLRYATSKIKSLDDLFNIRSLGFRGEALASIGAVSRMEIRSRFQGDDVGGLIRCEGGEVLACHRLPCQGGTTVRVEELFYNLPARRKFLRAAAAETRRISQFIQEVSLVWHDRWFTLASDGRRILDRRPTGSQREAVKALWGGDPREGFAEMDGVKCLAFWSGHGEGRGGMVMFVNQRRIWDTGIRAAIQGAVGSAKGEWVVFIDIPPEDVDVNVHPTKGEVRFKRPRDIFNVVYGAAQSAVGTAVSVNGRRFNVAQLSHGIMGSLRQADLAPFQRGESSEPSGLGWDTKDPSSDVLGKGFIVPEGDETPTGSIGGNGFGVDGPLDVSYIGKTSRGYLLYDLPRGVLFLDPHAAEERITFERIVNGSYGGTQVLAFPVEVPSSVASKVKLYMGVLERLGFSFTLGQPETLWLEGIPQSLSAFHVSPVEWLRWAVSSASSDDGRDTEEGLILRRMAERACKRSMKLGELVDPEGAVRLIRELFRCAVPHKCPHGRSTFFVVPWGDVESRLGR
ncbi:MAG: DNA mismatch repair endonuclease MutL [Thermanaerothrix sp.]|nr:DNA mismatch repair endonuclease MutL [Thermanaerothrix sp.]